LLGLGFDVEGLSPDINQKNNFTENIKAPFHHMGFEDFAQENQFDCIIMSESCQYINIDKIFENAKRALKKGGYLMICDYFVLKNATGELSKSGHDYDDFMSHIESSDFKIITTKDITESATKTLDFGKNYVERILTAIDIGTEKIRSRHPLFSKFILWLFRNKIEKSKQQFQLLDSDEFKRTKTYQFILLQVND